MKTRDDKSLLLQDWKVGFGIVFFAMLTSSILFQAVPWAAQALEPCFDARAVHGSSTFNATAAWDIEKARVEATAFNIEAWNITTIEYEGTTYNMTELSYETPNWVGATPATWRINGTLFSPTNASGDIGLMPGIVLFHGNGGNRQASYNYGLSFAALNCTVLCVDHVGQGDSQGPDITVENTVVQGAMNETAYVYLILCNGMQAVRLLRSYTGMVDVNRIAVSGFSLGGMTSITISAIYADKIALSIPIGYFGGLINMTAESSFWPGINMTRQEFLSYYASHPDCLNIL